MLRMTRFFASALIVTTLAGCGAEIPPSRELADRPAIDGITRTTLRDDSTMTVTRVHFAPGAAEPVHTHAFDLIVIPLQAGEVDLVIDRETIRGLDLGQVQFIARDLPHQLVNSTDTPFEVIAVTVR